MGHAAAGASTLHLLGLQYELALLIGKGIVLEPMLRAFFPPALRRLGCRAAYVWLRDEGLGTPQLRYAYPRHERERVEAGGDLAGLEPCFGVPLVEHVTTAGRPIALHWYPLATFGHCLLVCDRGPLEDLTQTALMPIMARLGDACGACLEHEHAQGARIREAEQEQQLRETILENSAVGIAFLNPQGRLLWANSALGRIFGRSSGAVEAGVSLESHYVSREEYERVGVAVTKAVSAGEVYVEELQMRRADGELFWAHLSGKAVNPKNLSRGTVWVVMDITQRRELEDELRRRTAEQEAILQSTQIGIAFTANRVHHWVNLTFANMVGFAAEELIGESSRQHFPDEAAFLKLGEDAYPVIARGEAFAGERLFMRKNGEVFPVQMYGKAVDAADPAKGAIWTVIDLTERNRLEEELQRTSREQELILQSTLVGIIFSRQRRNQWVNEAMARMLGYAADEMIGQSSRFQFLSDESWARFGAEAYPRLAANEEYSAEWQLAHKDGSPVWVHIIGKAVDPVQPLDASIWTVADITQHKKAEEDTRRALAQQKELNDLKTRFVSMASHEFRTPLATILSSTELLRYYGDKLPAEEKSDLLASIEAGVSRMTQMLDNILVIGRTDAGKLEFSPAPVSIAKLCMTIAREAARTYAPEDGMDRLDFDIRCPTEMAMLDERLVRHILGNLLSNAFKYSPERGRVQLTVSHRDDRMSLVVEDSGIGIPAEDLPRLFESFHRATNVGNISGTGLGMSIVKRAAELHGGTVGVESAVGTGTRFTVTLPWQAVAG